eukprot:1357420-Amorphochlora_amoeboformis.AAC.1
MATRSRHAVLGMLTRIGTRARGSPCTANPTFHIVRHLSALRIGESKEEKLQALGADSVFGRLFDPDVFASQEIDLKVIFLKRNEGRERERMRETRRERERERERERVAGETNGKRIGEEGTLRMEGMYSAVG